MGSSQGLIQQELGSSGNDLFAVIYKLAQHTAQRQSNGPTTDQGNVHNRKSGLQRTVTEQLIDDHSLVGITLELNDDAHAVPAGLVVDIRDALNDAGTDVISNPLDNGGLHDLVRNLGDDDDLFAGTDLLGMKLAPDGQLATACSIAVNDALASANGSAGGEVRAGHNLEQLFVSYLGIVNIAEQGLADLADIVRRNTGGHAHGNSSSTINQQIWELAG